MELIQKTSQQLIRLSDVLSIYIPISRSHWYRGIKSGKFPRPIRIGPRSCFYRISDIEALINACDRGDSDEVR
jgi:prophage regulatory protein